MLRYTLLLVLTVFMHAACFAQDSPDSQTTPAIEQSDGSLESSSENLAETDAVANVNVEDFLILTFILLMFTNAVICGQWALQTDRNFWGWYIFALFTGPFAGGCMLGRAGADKTAGKNPNGCLAAILGFGIPAAGWFIWIAILK